MLSTDPNRFRVETGAVLYGDTDVTGTFRGARADCRRTFQYYLLDHDMGEKVGFVGGYVPELGSLGGYALLRDGRICFVKIPT